MIQKQVGVKKKIAEFSGTWDYTAIRDVPKQVLGPRASQYWATPN